MQILSVLYMYVRFSLNQLKSYMTLTKLKKMEILLKLNQNIEDGRLILLLFVVFYFNLHVWRIF